ncbi:MAG: hypothetical protein EP343_27630 [Deltaproteobacteria bacterium]|nr:MAG: hypothetical protein EP343_27630 [Deltaproteobacteria bacterium]
MIEILVIVEAGADFRTASCLADRVIAEKSSEEGNDWVGDNLEDLRQWVGFSPSTSYSCWKDIKSIRAQKQGSPRMLGHLRGEPLGSDGTAARLVVLMAEQELKYRPNLRAIMFIRDLDVHSQKQKRIESINRVRDAYKDLFTIVLGVADPKREAWVLNGFVPQGAEEKAAVEELHKTLGFDPCLDAHKLRTVGLNNPKEQERNIKEVLDELTGKDYDREEKCWSVTPLELLSKRGEETYLSDFLIEVEEFLLPLMGE